MARPPVLIVAPMALELAPVLRMVTERRRSRGLITGLLDGRPVVLGLLGEGRRAGPATNRLLQAVNPASLWLVGIAGALTDPPALAEALVADLVRSEDGGELRPSVSGVRGVLSGVVVSVDRWADADRKRALADTVPGRPAVVDLEAYAVGSAASAAGVPWAVVRGVSDGHDEDLPAVLTGAQRPDGSANPWKVVARALTRSSGPAALVRLSMRSRAAAAAAAEVVARGIFER